MRTPDGRLADNLKRGMSTISATTFPSQGSHLNKQVSCYFNYNTSACVSGICVRDDRGEPWVTIFKLDDGRYILAVECCQYRVID